MNCSLIGHEGKEPNTPHKIAEKCCKGLLNYLGHIDKLVEKQTSKEIENNRLRLKTLVECAQWLAFQEVMMKASIQKIWVILLN